MPEENERICSLRYCPLNHVANDSDKCINPLFYKNSFHYYQHFSQMLHIICQTSISQ